MTLSRILPFLRLIARENNLRLNRMKEFIVALEIYKTKLN